MIEFSNGEKFLNVREIARLLNVSPRRVYEFFDAGILVNENKLSTKKMVSEQTLINKCFARGDKMVTPVAN